eukprot:COSAG01_NODE_74842_length_199_cov_985.440000_1_plen_32_part_10
MLPCYLCSARRVAIIGYLKEHAPEKIKGGLQV